MPLNSSKDVCNTFQEVIHETMKESCLHTTTTTRVDNVLKDEVHAVTTTTTTIIATTAQTTATSSTTTQGSLVVVIM